MFFIYFEHRNKRRLIGHAEDEKAAKAMLNSLAKQFIARNEGEPRADKRWIVDGASVDTLGYWIKYEENKIGLYRLIEEEEPGLIWNSTTDVLKREGGWWVLEHDLSLKDPFKELFEARDQLVILKEEIIAAKKEVHKWKEKYQSRAGAKIAEVYENEPDTSVEDLANHFKSKISTSSQIDPSALGAMLRQSLTENSKYQEMHRKCEMHTVGDE